jgi:HD-GYP domain-containing protein (c-di-GMP phosphodiesterase class II)
VTVQLTTGEAVATLSLAADVGFALPLETGLQVCAVGLALGERMGLDDGELERVFLLSLLRHIGCTAGSDEAAAAMGDEIAIRGISIRQDVTDKRAMLGPMLRLVAATNPASRRPLAFMRLLAAAGTAAAASGAAVCEAATTLAARIGVDPRTLADIDVYYERWDGKGLRRTAAGDAIPRPVCAVQVAETATVVMQVDGLDAATAFVRDHAGGMFAPEAAAAFLAAPADLAGAADTTSLWEEAVGRAPAPLPADELEAVFELLADFSDLRSVWLGGHSRGVAALAAEGARRAKLSAEDVATIRRAGLVHDVGRVAVSAAVWGKAASLTSAEWEQVRLHPYHTERVLSRPPALAEIGRLASFHHERGDGSGYHRGTRELSAPARLLAAADAFHAMSEPRPHRAALPLDHAARELRAGVRAGAYGGDAVECVLAAAGAAPRRPEAVGGLSPREVEVLRLIARGRTKAQVAKELVIAPKTADAHVQHIYAKIGVSTRSGATLFAMRHGLLESLPDGS